MEERLILYQDQNEEEVSAILEHLKAQSITSCEMTYSLEEETFDITISKEEFDTAKPLVLEYLNTLLDKEEVHEEEEPPAKSYVDKKTQYEDMSSSAYTLIGFGVIGLIVLFLEISGITSFLPLDANIKWLFYVTMGLMFIIFLVIGIKSITSARTLKYEMVKEEELTNQVMNWAKEFFTSETIEHAHDEDLSETDLYFARYRIIKDGINGQFHDLEPSFLEELVEQIYCNLYEDTKENK